MRRKRVCVSFAWGGVLVTKSLRLGDVESHYLAEIGSPVSKTGFNTI